MFYTIVYVKGEHEYIITTDNREEYGKLEQALIQENYSYHKCHNIDPRLIMPGFYNENILRG